MISAILGATAVLAGLSGMWIWRSDFLSFLRGSMPFSLVLAGIAGVIAGLAGFKKRG